MSPYQNRIGIGILVHCLFQALRKILFKRGVLNNGDSQGIVETEHAFALAPGDTLDLLDVADLEVGVFTVVALDEQRHQHRPL